MPTQAEVRQLAKRRVRLMRSSLKVVDTRLELMDRRLMKLLDRKTLITVGAFDSFLRQMDGFYARIREFERFVINVMTVFLTE